MIRRQIFGLGVCAILLAAGFSTVRQMRSADSPASAFTIEKEKDMPDNGQTLSAADRLTVIGPIRTFILAVRTGHGTPGKMSADGEPNQATVAIVRRRLPDLMRFVSYSIGHAMTYNDGTTVDVDMYAVMPNGIRKKYYVVLLRRGGVYGVAFIV